MNVVKKESDIGQWSLTIKKCSRLIGPTIDVLIKQSAVDHDHIIYTVEIKKSRIFNDGLIIAALKVPNIGADARIAMSVFRTEDFGLRTYRLGLHPTMALGERAYIMTIDGLFWNGQITHVRKT